MSSTRVLYISLSLFIAAACTQEPAQIVLNRVNIPEKGSHSENSVNPFKVVAKQGDTIYKISKAHDVSIRGLIDLNNLRPPYELTAGQSLRLPKATFHIVKPLDNIYTISRSYEVDMNSLVRNNNIEPPYVIHPGMKLKIPSKTEEDNNTQFAYNDTENYSRDVATSGNDNYVSDNSVKSQDLAPVSSHQLSENKVQEGKLLQPEPKPSIITKTPNQTLSSPIKSADLTKSFSPASSGNVDFSWPTKGRVVSSFGPKSGGLYNDGINISAPLGTPFNAAESGEVVYAGNELKGYGNLLLIKHQNGYLSAYAHADQLLVNKGDIVQKGQAIGKIGKSGDVTSPQLHFSIRQGKQAVDPEKFLASAVSNK